LERHCSPLPLGHVREERGLSLGEELHVALVGVLARRHILTKALSPVQRLATADARVEGLIDKLTMLIRQGAVCYWHLLPPLDDRIDGRAVARAPAHTPATATSAEGAVCP